LSYSRLYKKITRQVSVAGYLAWGDTRARYKRSVLGPFWLVLTTAIGVAGLGYIWSILFNQKKEVFIPALTVGLVVWQFIAGCVTESAGLFIRNAPIIKNTQQPLQLLPMQLLLQQLIVFCHNFIVIACVLMIFPPPGAIPFWLLIPGFLLCFLNLFWVIVLISVLGARYRDLEPAINSFISVIFFLSPVIYRPQQLGAKAKLMWFNPATYLITLLRDPLQGNVPDLFVYEVSFAMLVLGSLLAYYVMRRNRFRIAFWV
jgi:ABC-type polysaccharide/polyol phosphate export permease